MYIAISFFFISLVLIMLLILNKSREFNTGVAFVSFNGKIDNFFNSKYIFLKKIITEFPKHFGREALYAGVHKSLKLSDRIQAFMHSKIGHIIEAVKGKHFPKSQKESSSFLVHIEKHKENSADSIE